VASISILTSRRRRGTYGTGLALVARLGAVSRAGRRHFAWHVALGDIDVSWQAWHLVTSTFVLRGRRGTWPHPPAFCVAGDIRFHFALHVRRGTYGTGPALVVRLGAVSRRHFACQAW